MSEPRSTLCLCVGFATAGVMRKDLTRQTPNL